VFREEDAEELYQDKDIDEVAVLRLFHVLFPHEVHELADEFRDHEVEGRGD
jgi:hypothetical protein